MDLTPLQVIRRGFADVFVGHAPGRVADIQQILAELPVDAMLCDGLMLGVGLVSELGGPPWATFGDGPLPHEEPDTPPFGPGMLPMRGPVGRLRNRVVRAAGRRLIFRDADMVYRRVRADLGLPQPERFVLDEMTSPFLHLQGSTPGFEYPMRALPPHMHYVGALRPDPPTNWTAPPWWADVTDAAAPVVLVTQGSIRPDPAELLLPAIEGLAGEDVLVVVTTGQGDPADVTAKLGALPSNVRVTRFVPYDVGLRHADVFVTNGGYTGVTLALAHGVPLVQAGTTEEKAEIAARIHYAGVGVRLGPIKPAPAAVRDGVRRVLRRARVRRRRPPGAGRDGRPRRRCGGRRPAGAARRNRSAGAASPPDRGGRGGLR